MIGRPLAILALLALVSVPASAQCSGGSCTVTISMPVAQVLRLTLSSTTTNLGNPTPADFTTGYKDATGPIVTVKANRAWHVSVSGTAARFTYTGSLGNPNKPVGDLGWGTSSGSYPNNLGTPATFASGTPGITSRTIYFRTQWHLTTDVPGNYQAVVAFTLSAP